MRKFLEELIINMADDSDRPKMKLKVHIRLRPLSGYEKNGIVRPEHKLMYLQDPAKPGHSSEYVFDRIFDAEAKQDDIFEEVHT
jgi:kinesin family protein 7